MSNFVNYVHLLERAQRMYHAGGLPRGDSTGWACVDELFTVLPGQWTVVTGIPQSGKSEWLDALSINLMATDEWEFVVYSPENWPTETHLVKLAEKSLRKPFGTGPTARMTEQEFLDFCHWLFPRYSWIDSELQTPEMLIALAAVRGGVSGKKVGIVLDPWNTLDHNRGGMNETDYISMILTDVTRAARKSGAHIFLVVHPAKLQKDRVTGLRPVPTPYDISGSAHWYNKADNIITVHRKQGEDTQEVEIHVQKVRFKHVGHVGMTTLLYDRVTGVYFEPPCPPGFLVRERYSAPPAPRRSTKTEVTF